MQVPRMYTVRLLKAVGLLAEDWIAFDNQMEIVQEEIFGPLLLMKARRSAADTH